MKLRVLLMTIVFLVCANQWTFAKEKTMDPKNQEQIKIYDVQSGDYKTVDKIIKSDAEWKKILPPNVYHVAREHGTERPFCELPHKDKKSGLYRCSSCGTDLFIFDTKFESG